MLFSILEEIHWNKISRIKKVMTKILGIMQTSTQGAHTNAPLPREVTTLYNLIEMKLTIGHLPS